MNTLHQKSEVRSRKSVMACGFAVLLWLTAFVQAQTAIELGTSPTGAGGDTNRQAFTKVNTNFTNIYGRQITIAGTSGEITSSAGAQTLASDRTWTLSLASAVTRDAEWDTAAEVETIWGANIILATEIDTIAELNALIGDADLQPLDADLTAIAALSGTNTLYYRSAANTWTAVTIGSGLSFATGTLSATGGAGTGSVNTIKEDGAQVGGTDIVTIDFLGADFDVAESPDTEVNLTIASGITRDTEWDSIGEIETAIGGGNILLATEIDTSAELAGILGDETGSGGGFVRATGPTISDPVLTGTTTVATLAVTTFSATNFLMSNGASIKDAGSNELITFTTTGSAVNELTFANAATGNNPQWSATGGDTDIGINWLPKGAGKFEFRATASGPAEVRFFEDSDNGSHYVGVTAPASIGSNIALTWPAASGTLATTAGTGLPDVWIVAISDETTAITTGTAKATFRAPYAATVTAVRANLNTVSSSGDPAFNIKEGGVSILSTTLTIDASEKTSTTAATAAVISDTSIADDAEITIDIDTAGTGAKGGKIHIYVTRQ